MTETFQDYEKRSRRDSKWFDKAVRRAERRIDDKKVPKEVYDDCIVCPYCGSTNYESYLVHRDRVEWHDSDMGCNSCGKIFECIKTVSVTYSTKTKEQEC